MAEETPLTWRKLVNGIGSVFIAYLVVFLLLALVIPPGVGSAGTVVSIFVGAVLAVGLYVFFERL